MPSSTAGTPSAQPMQIVLTPSDGDASSSGTGQQSPQQENPGQQSPEQQHNPQQRQAGSTSAVAIGTGTMPANSTQQQPQGAEPSAPGGGTAANPDRQQPQGSDKNPKEQPAPGARETQLLAVLPGTPGCPPVRISIFITARRRLLMHRRMLRGWGR